MKKPTHSMTLRLSPDVAEAVENRAYERGCSKGDWIRAAIRKSLLQEHESEILAENQRIVDRFAHGNSPEIEAKRSISREKLLAFRNKLKRETPQGNSHARIVGRH